MAEAAALEARARHRPQREGGPSLTLTQVYSLCREHQLLCSPLNNLQVGSSSQPLSPLIHSLSLLIHSLSPLIHSLSPLIHSPSPLIHSPSPLIHSLSPLIHS